MAGGNGGASVLRSGGGAGGTIDPVTGLARAGSPGGNSGGGLYGGAGGGSAGGGAGGTSAGGGNGGTGGSNALPIIDLANTQSNATSGTGGAGTAGQTSSNVFLHGGGGGGEGGYGLIVTGSNAPFTNSGNLTGGLGGNGGAGAFAGQGGFGGIGLDILGSNVTVNNSGALTGGAGGSPDATGGAGLQGGNGLTVATTGAITGGPVFNGATARASAIAFTGGSNTLAIGIDAGTGVQAAITGGIAVTGTLTFDQSAGGFTNDVALSGAISGTGSIVKVGATTLTLSGLSTYAGSTSITGGALALSGNGSIASSSSVSVVSTFDISGVTAVNAAGNPGTSIRDLSGSGSVKLGGDTLTVTNAASTFSGIISDGGFSGGSGGKLALTGGTLTLSNANTYTGGTNVSGGGTLAITRGDALSSGTITLSNGTLSNPNGSALTNALSMGTGGGTLSGGAFLLNGAVSGTGNLTFATSVALGADNSGFSGASILNSGSLIQARNANAFSASSAFQVKSGATLDLNGFNETIASLSDGANGASGGTVINNAGGLTILTIGGPASTTFAGTLQNGSGGLGLTLAAGHTGTLTLSGTNNYTGATTINGGTLQLGNGGATGSLSATTTISIGTNGTLAINHSDVLALANTLSGTGAFQQAGLGGVLLSGANAGYSGAVTLNAGTLELNHRTGTTIDAAGTGTVTFAAGAQTLRLDTAGTLANTIVNFGAGDSIDLRAITYAGAALSVVGNTVTVAESAANGGDVNVLTLGAAPSGLRFVLADDGSGFAAIKLGAIPPLTGPTAVNDTANATFGTVLNATAPGVLANDSGSGGTKTVSAVNGQTTGVGNAVAGAYGSLTLNGDGSYSYTPDATKTVFTTSVVDHFTYTLPGNGLTSTANLDITVSAPSASTLALFGTVVTNSASQTGSVYALYEGLLGRAPDALGLEAFSASLQAGAKLTDVASAILGSAERGGVVSDPTAYVQSLYTNALHRTADSAGLNYFTGELNAGVSQATVAVQIASSTEAQQVNAPAFSTGVFVTDAIDAGVARLYYGLLGRTPDAGGLSGFEAQVKQLAASGGVAGAVQGLASVANAMLGSAEYGQAHAGQTSAAFVDSLYVGALGRHADAGGSAFFTNELAQGVSQATVALQIAQSQEAQVHLVGQIELGWHLA